MAIVTSGLGHNFQLLRSADLRERDLTDIGSAHRVPDPQCRGLIEAAPVVIIEGQVLTQRPGDVLGSENRLTGSSLEGDANR